MGLGLGLAARAKDVALVAQDAQLLLLPLALLVGLVDDGVELGDLARELRDQLVVLAAEGGAREPGAPITGGLTGLTELTYRLDLLTY